MFRYWEECIREALEDCGLSATDEQIEVIVDTVEGAHDNYGMAFGHDAIPNPIMKENEDLKRQLKLEQDKVTCPDCRGNGEIITTGPVHSSISQCDACRGEGRRLLWRSR